MSDQEGTVSIRTEGLTRRFGKILAVHHLDLDVRKGEIFGILGPNGAGKTTTINMLTTMLRPSSGRAWVAGHDVLDRPDRVRGVIGIVFQEPSVDDLLTGRENLEMHARLYGMPRKGRRAAIREMLQLVGLEDRAGDLVKTYSGGMRRRLEVARGIMHRPGVLFLDEPTLGLDPHSREQIWRYLRELRRRAEMTMVISTHYMEEADYLCDRIMIMDRGRMMATGTPRELKGSVGLERVRLFQKRPDPGGLKGLEFVTRIEVEKDSLILSVRDAGRNLQKILNRAGEIDSLEITPITLKDVFLHFTGRPLEGRGPAEGGFWEREMKSRSLRR